MCFVVDFQVLSPRRWGDVGVGSGVGAGVGVGVVAGPGAGTKRIDVHVKK